MSLDDDIASHERELNRLRKVKTMAAEICRALAAVPDDYRKDVLRAIREQFCSKCGSPDGGIVCEQCNPRGR